MSDNAKERPRGLLDTDVSVAELRKEAFREGRHQALEGDLPDGY